MLVVDSVVAGLVAAFGLLIVVTSALAWSDAALVLALSVPLAWRRTFPVLAGAVVAAAAFGHLAVSSDMSPVAPVAVPVAVYALAAYAPRPWANIALVVAVTGGALAGISFFGRYEGRTLFDTVSSAMMVALFVGGVWAFGRLRGLRVREMEALTERNRLLEVERLKEAELAATQERTASRGRCTTSWRIRSLRSLRRQTVSVRSVGRPECCGHRTHDDLGSGSTGVDRHAIASVGAEGGCAA